MMTFVRFVGFLREQTIGYEQCSRNIRRRNIQKRAGDGRTSSLKAPCVLVLSSSVKTHHSLFRFMTRDKIFFQTDVQHTAHAVFRVLVENSSRHDARHFSLEVGNCACPIFGSASSWQNARVLILLCTQTFYIYLP